MKYIFLLIFPLLAFAAYSCKKVPTGPITAVVVKDCTGVYLRINGDDYHVCNEDELKKLKDGDKITTNYRKLSKCAAANDRIVCMMLHENKGWIEVQTVKAQ